MRKKMAIPKIERYTNNEDPQTLHKLSYDRRANIYICACGEEFTEALHDGWNAFERSARLQFIEHLLVENVI